MLLTAWEVKSTNQLTQAGYDGATTEKWPTHFVEVAHDGSGGGEIVWEWHIWDHLIQDHDETKDNYGVVADHPELIDINMIWLVAVAVLVVAALVVVALVDQAAIGFM